MLDKGARGISKRSEGAAQEDAEHTEGIRGTPGTVNMPEGPGERDDNHAAMGSSIRGDSFVR